MTVIDLTTAFTNDDLLAACAELGVRRPLGLSESMARHPAAGSRPGKPPLGVTVSDATAAALVVLAAPEAIAVVERTAGARKRVTYVATRGPWGAVHRIHGDHHIVESLDAEDAASELLSAAALDEGDASAQASPDATLAAIDLTRGAFDRMAELVAAGDLIRATAALEADGADSTLARTVTAAARCSITHVLGLRSLGPRYEGCELAWLGDGPRWLAPLPARSADTGAVAAQLGAPRHLRVQIAPAAPSWLTEELAALFD